MPPPSSPPQTSLLPLPSLSPGWLLSNLAKLDIHQDFHLPDEQFGSLKLHKLCQVPVESGIEHFSTPSHNTRSSIQRTYLNYTSSDQLTPLHLPLSFTPPIANSAHPSGARLPATPCLGVKNLSKDYIQSDKMKNESLAEDQNITDSDVNQQAEILQTETHNNSTDSLSVVEKYTEDCVKHKGNETVTQHSHNQSRTSMNYDNNPLPHQSFTDRPQCKVNDRIIGPAGDLESEQPASENQTACGGAVHSLQDQSSGNPQGENRAITETLSSDYSQKETPEEPCNTCTALQACVDTEAPGESPVSDTTKQSSSEEAGDHSASKANFSSDRLSEKKTTCPLGASQVLMGPLASASCPFITPHLPSSTQTSSPVLPSLGLTPFPVAVVPPPNPSLSAPPLTLPPPHSPSTQNLSPPALSPCPSITHLPPSLPPLSLSSPVQVSCEPPDTSDQCQEVEPAACPTQSNSQLQSPAGRVGLIREEAAGKQMMRCTHTLKAAAGGCLVDVCCLSRSSGDVCVAAAGKWAVCLWSQTAASDWGLIHTWTFSEPVISVFPVPDAAGLMCVTLGQLEIREMRMLSCSSLMQMLVCEGVIQAVVGMSESRVVTSSHSASGSTLQVFTLSDGSSSPISQPLVSPGVCVGALAPVDGLSDALIGTDECGHLFIWNLKTGQLLCRVLLGHALSHTACLKGYSYSGMLLVLLQHQFLSSMEEEEKGVKIKDEMFFEEEKKTTLFSLVGINPLNGKSILAARLHPPKAWSGRLCEADVNQSTIVGLSQRGCLCVWELGKRGAAQTLGAPEGEDWQLVRWGGKNRLVIGHHNGDVSLHHYSGDQI